MNRSTTLALVTALALAAAPPGASIAGPRPPQPPFGTAPTLAGSSTAVTEEILDAIAEEMNRAITSLEIGRAGKPYHVSYKITEVDVNDVVASLGHATVEKNRHFVTIEARVRVGSKAFDNANFVIAGGEQFDGVVSFPLPLEPDPRIARRAAWLVTDQAYKEALVQLKYKEDARASGTGTAGVPSWSDAPTVVAEEPVLVAALERLDAMTARAERVSATLRGRGLRDSRVAFTSYLERRWYLSSDGTSAHDTRRVSGVLVAAIGQADDGQDLPQYLVRYGHTAADLPADGALQQEAARLADTVAALAKAPRLERYTGPVLFEGEGAVGLVRHTLAPHLGGTPLPEGLRPQDAKLFGGALNDKVGLKVTSNLLTIVDDPTAAASAGKALIGGYRLDDEGVGAQKVTVVKDGMLASLLHSRTPAGAQHASNGHARRTAAGGMFHGTATNLVITARGGLDRKKLVARLLAEAKDGGLDHALIVKQLDDAAITAQPEMTRRELLAMFQNADAELPPPAILVYRVTAGGKEELVRAGQLGEVPVKAWKDVLAAGKTATVANFLAASDGYVIQRINGSGEGAVPSAGIESSVTTPDLLFAELDVLPYALGQRTRPILPPPDLAK